MNRGFSVSSRIRAGLMAVVLACACVGGAVAQGYEISGLNIAPGADGTQLNFAWFTATASKKPVVQLAKRADQKGDAFPVARAKTFTGTGTAVRATPFNGDDRSVPTDEYANKVTVSGLSGSTAYVYRVGDGKVWSESYPVSTGNGKSFGFFAVGDPQVGSKATGPRTLESDTNGWKTTVAKATEKYPAADFLLTLGDEVNDYNKLATQVAEYAAFFSPEQLRSLPLATIDGNHDFQMGEYYGYHYNQPNLSATGSSYGNDGDYWFVYGNALFLMLNSNTQSVAAHDVFIRDAVARNPAARWRIACMHHSVYSEADHFADPDIVDRRATFPAVFERYKIDVVLQGHDHAYTRTFPMLQGKPVDGGDPKAASITNPAGIVYFTLDSGSGSKFYEWHSQTPEVFSAVRWQGKVPSFSYVSVQGGTFTITTYRTDDMSVIDTYSIVKK